MWNIYRESYDLTRTSCIFLFFHLEIFPEQKKCVCDVCQLSMDLPSAQTPMCLGLVRVHTHVVIIYAPCLMFSGCVGPLLWSTYKYISVQEPAARNMGSLLIHIFSIVENIMPFPPNLPLSGGSLLPFWKQETALCMCVFACVSLIVPSQVPRYHCDVCVPPPTSMRIPPLSDEPAVLLKR